MYIYIHSFICGYSKKAFCALILERNVNGVFLVLLVICCKSELIWGVEVCLQEVPRAFAFCW